MALSRLWNSSQRAQSKKKNKKTYTTSTYNPISE